MTWHRIDTLARALVRGEIAWLAIIYAYFVVTDTVPLGAFAFIALMWLVRWWTTGTLTRRTPFDLPILFLLAWLPVSFSVTIDPALSLPKVYGVVLCVAFFYAIVNAIQTRRDLARATLWLVVVCAGIALAGLVGTDWAQDKIVSASFIYEHLPRFVQGIPRSIAGGFARNGVGGTLAFTIPLLAALALTKDERRMAKVFLSSFVLRPSSFVWFALGLSLLTLALTQSRGGILGTVAGLLVVAVWRERKFVWVIGAGVLALIALLALGYGNVLLEFLLHMDARNATLASRLEVWQRGLMMVRDFPYTGIGIGTFNPLAHLMYPFFIAAPDEVVAHAHNQFLEVAVDLGIPGLFAYIGLLVVFGVCVVRAYRANQDTSVRAWLVGLAAGLLAHHVFGLTDAFILGTKPGIVMWVFFAFAAVLDRRPTIEDRGQKTNDERRMTDDKDRLSSFVLRPPSFVFRLSSKHFWNTTWFRVTIGTLISIVFLVLALKDVPLDEVAQALGRVNYFWVALAVIAMFAQSWLRALRWIQLYHPLQKELRVFQMLGIVLVSQMLNIIVPWRVGEIARIFLASEIAKRSAAQTIATLAVEKFLDVLMMLALLLMIPVFITLPGWLERPREGIVVSAIGLFVGVFILLLSGDWLVKVLSQMPLPWGKKFISENVRIALSGLDVFKHWNLHLALQVMSVMIYFLGGVVNYLTFLAMDMQLPFLSAFLLFAVLQVGGLVPSSPGKVGVFQYLCILTLALFAVDKSVGLTYGILLYLIAYGTPIVLGILFVWWGGVNLREVAKDR